MKKYKVKYSKDRISEAGERILAWRNGKKTHQIPFIFLMNNPPQKYTLGEKVRDSDKAIEDAVACMNHQLSEFPDCDYIPVFRMEYLGEGLIPTMFGAKQRIAKDDPPYTEGRVMKNLEKDLPGLKKKINPEKDGWGPILKECVEKFLDATNYEIPVGICDIQSPYGLATKLIGNGELMIAMYDTPELVHELMKIVTNATIDTIKAMKKWVGNPELLIKNLMDPLPGGGIILCDDFVSVISPKLHEEFCLPYNLKLYQEFGKGHFHTCGPYFPNFLDAIVKNNPASIEITIQRDMSKTRDDMLQLKNTVRNLDINMYGNLTASKVHVLDENDRIPPDMEFVYLMAEDGGLFWWETGSKEEGLKYLEISKKV